MLAMRGVTLSYETVREWCRMFGQTMPMTEELIGIEGRARLLQ